MSYIHVDIEHRVLDCFFSHILTLHWFFYLFEKGHICFFKHLYGRLGKWRFWKLLNTIGWCEVRFPSKILSQVNINHPRNQNGYRIFFFSETDRHWIIYTLHCRGVQRWELTEGPNRECLFHERQAEVHDRQMKNVNISNRSFIQWLLNSINR